MNLVTRWCPCRVTGCWLEYNCLELLSQPPTCRIPDKSRNGCRNRKQLELAITRPFLRVSISSANRSSCETDIQYSSANCNSVLVRMRWACLVPLSEHDNCWWSAALKQWSVSDKWNSGSDPKEWVWFWDWQYTVNMGSSIWHIVCHSGCRWVNQLHTWIRIITWQFIIKEHVTLILLHIWCVLFPPLLLMYSVIICVQGV